MIVLVFILILLTFSNVYAEKFSQPVDSNPMLQLVSLPYDYDDLQPVISERTMQLHHGKHLHGYVDRLARYIINTPYSNMPLSRIVIMSDSSVYDQELFDNAGHVLNHNLYFLQFSPHGGGEPQGALAKAIVNRWGSFEEFKHAFTQNGSQLFGSGWVWLACDHEGHLYIVQEPNGGNPVTHGMTPLLGIDVWEHAYYLDYQNRRTDHIDAVWNIIDWPVIEARYEATGVSDNCCQTAVEKMWEE